MPGLSVHYCVSDLHRVRRRNPIRILTLKPKLFLIKQTPPIRRESVTWAEPQWSSPSLSWVRRSMESITRPSCTAGVDRPHYIQLFIHSVPGLIWVFMFMFVFLGWTAQAGEWPVWMWTGWWRFGPSIPSCKPKPRSCPSPRCSLWNGRPSPTDWWVTSWE